MRASAIRPTEARTKVNDNRMLIRGTLSTAVISGRLKRRKREAVILVRKKQKNLSTGGSTYGRRSHTMHKLVTGIPA